MATQQHNDSSGRIDSPVARTARQAPAKLRAAIRKTLLDAARFIDANGNTHPARAIWCVQASRPMRAAAWHRLCDVGGMDYADHTREENIDDCVAAALWED